MQPSAVNEFVTSALGEIPYRARTRRFDVHHLNRSYFSAAVMRDCLADCGQRSAFVLPKAGGRHGDQQTNQASAASTC